MNIVVSVVMPSFNSIKHIGEALTSAQRQSFQDFELIVVDGGSKDNSRDTVLQICQQDSRVKLIDNVDDRGPAHARSVGIKHAKGRYVAFLDADDVWLPQKLEYQVSFMLQTGARFS